MKWLTIEYIKDHSRIDYDCEDGALELYGNSAEQTVMNHLGRTYEDIVANYSTVDKKVPADIIHASLLLTEHFYTHRGATETVNVTVLPFAVDMLLKPYIRLSGTFRNEVRNKLIDRMGTERQKLDFYVRERPLPEEAKELYERIKSTTAWFGIFNDPADEILESMKEVTVEVENDVEEYLKNYRGL